jgi:hypothetical protein
MCPDRFEIQDIIELLNKYKNFIDLNKFLEQKTGIINFFNSKNELMQFRQNLKIFNLKQSNKDLGDFQTPIILTDKICKTISKKKYDPEIILEPTAGMGNFIISAIKNFPNLKHIYAIEKQHRYEIIFKLRILKLIDQLDINCKIEYYNEDIFRHNFSNRFKSIVNEKSLKFLILGNPPWITNSELSTLNSDNLPKKINIKKFRGIDAITGKSNFDISEFIIIYLIKKFSYTKGKIALLCKTSVIKNIIKNIRKLSLNLSNIEQIVFNAKEEFNTNVHAALLFADLLQNEKVYCSISSLYGSKNNFEKYGWFKNKFVSNIDLYEKFIDLDGQSSYEWRQGVKHDAIKIMILESNKNGNLYNGYGEELEIENKLLFPFIKGSNLKNHIINNSSKKIIITQSKPNMDTDSGFSII